MIRWKDPKLSCSRLEFWCWVGVVRNEVEGIYIYISWNAWKSKNLFFSFVTYWPSTEMSIKKHVHPVEDIRVSPWPVAEFGAIATPTGSRWASNNYITGCHRRLELVGVSYNWSLSCSSRQWEPAPDRGLAALSDPRLSSPAEWERSAAIEELGVNMLQSVPSPTHLSHTTLSQPFWE